MKRTILLGSTGLLGQALKLSLQRDTELLSPDRRSLDVTNFAELQSYLHEIKPSTIINAVGLQGDAQCAAKPELAHLLNSQLPEELSKFCGISEARLLHFSCADVYGEPTSSTNGLSEDAATNPQSVYAKSKLSGDDAIQRHCENYLIFRLTALYSAQTLGSGLKQEIAGRDPILAGAPTSSDYVADTVARILSRIDRRVIKAQWGVYHLGAKGVASWEEFSQQVDLRREKGGLSADYRSIDESGKDLNVEKIEGTYCLSLPSWQSLIKA